jgi:hypothetical protein
MEYIEATPLYEPDCAECGAVDGAVEEVDSRTEA